jgi:hypothetical protein
MAEILGYIIGAFVIVLVGLFALMFIVSGLNSIRKSIWEIRNVNVTRHMTGEERREAWRNGGQLPPVEHE